jgi:hypothetical protein
MATKKATKAKKPTERKSPMYETTAKAFPELSGQGKIVHAALVKVQPATAAQIADACGKLETKQKPRTVVSYYLQVWKSEKLVKNAKPAKEVAAKAA